MNTYWKAGLLAGVSMGLVLGAYADDAATTEDESRSLDTIIVLGSLMKKVLHITERKRKSNVHHYCKSDDFRAGFKVAEWRMFCH